MHLKELSEQLAEKENISVCKAKKVINSTLDLITDALNRNDVVYLRRLGKIYLRWRYWKSRRNNLFHCQATAKLGFWERRQKVDGYSLQPHIKLSKMFKRRAKGKFLEDKSTTSHLKM